MFPTTVTIEGHENTFPHHILTDDESALLAQIIDIDGSDEVILASEDIRNGSGRVVGSHLTIRPDAWDDVLAEQIAHLDGYGAYVDNAGGTHITDGSAAWFLGFGYDRVELYGDLVAWSTGEWVPSEGDGQVRESLADYARGAEATDSRQLSTTDDILGGL